MATEKWGVGAAKSKIRTANQSRCGAYAQEGPLHRCVRWQGSMLTGWAVGASGDKEIALTANSFQQWQGFMFMIIPGARQRCGAPD